MNFNVSLLLFIFLNTVGNALASPGEIANELCPRTTEFFEEPRKLESECRNSQLSSNSCMGDVERTAISFAELNGYISGTPVLLFETGSSELSFSRSECLTRFANVYAKAIKAGGFTTRNGASLAISVIGHADGPKSPALNFRISYARAFHVREKLVSLLNRELGWSRRYLRELISAEGRGEEEPWWCGADKRCEFRELALAATPGSSGPDPKTLSVDQDRRVEIRLTASKVLAGPRLEEFLSSDNSGWRLAFDDARMRFYPDGTQPLAPVSLTLAKRDFDSSNRVCQIVDGEGVNNGQSAPSAKSPWLDTDWQHLAISEWSKLEPRSIEGQTLEANLFIRLRTIPAVTSRGRTSPQEVRLVLDVASLLISYQSAREHDATVPLIAEADQPATPAPAMPMDLVPQSGLQPEEAEVIRVDLGLGIPDYWLVRLRLNRHLSDILNRDKQTAAWSDCIKSFVPPDEFAGTIEIEDRVTHFPEWTTRFVLAYLPKDYEGLAAHLYDSNPRVAMFGLRPGHRLRFITGNLMLPMPLLNTDGLSPAAVGSSFELPLYTAPTSILFGRPGQPDNAPEEWTGAERTTFGGDINLLRRSGPEGHLAVTIEPGIQRYWGRQNHLFDYPNLPSREESQIPELASIQHLERFLRGRVVRVFLPHGETEKPVIQNIQGGTFPDTLDANENRDVVLVAADSFNELDTFLVRYNEDDLLAMDDKAICRNILENVYCGYFRQPMVLSLQVEANISGKSRSVPLGATIGNLMHPRVLAPCFLEVGEGASGHGRFEVGDRLTNPIRLDRLSDLLAAPDLFDDDDCRLLGLPVLGGGRMDFND